MASWAETAAAAALNGGADYSKAASQTLSDASDTLQKYIDNTNTTFRNGMTDLNSLFTNINSGIDSALASQLSDAALASNKENQAAAIVRDEIEQKARDNAKEKASDNQNDHYNAIYGKNPPIEYEPVPNKNESNTNPQKAQTAAPQTGNALQDYANSDEWKGKDLNEQFKQAGEEARVKYAATEAAKNAQRETTLKITGGVEPEKINEAITLNANNITARDAIERTKGGQDPKTGKAWDDTQFAITTDNPLKGIDTNTLMEALASPDSATQKYRTGYLSALQYRAIIALSGIEGMRRSAENYIAAQYEEQEAKRGNLSDEARYALARQLKEQLPNIYRYQTIQDIFDGLTAKQLTRQGRKYQTAIKDHQEMRSDMQNLMNTGNAAMPVTPKKDEEDLNGEGSDDDAQTQQPTSTKTTVSGSKTTTKTTTGGSNNVATTPQATASSAAEAAEEATTNEAPVDDSAEEQTTEEVSRWGEYTPSEMKQQYGTIVEQNQDLVQHAMKMNIPKAYSQKQVDALKKMEQDRGYLDATLYVPTAADGMAIANYAILTSNPAAKYIKDAPTLDFELYEDIIFGVAGAQTQHGKGMQAKDKNVGIYPDIDNNWLEKLRGYDPDQIEAQIRFVESEIGSAPENAREGLRQYAEFLGKLKPLVESVKQYEAKTDTYALSINAALNKYNEVQEREQSLNQEIEEQNKQLTELVNNSNGVADTTTTSAKAEIMKKLNNKKTELTSVKKDQYVAEKAMVHSLVNAPMNAGGKIFEESMNVAKHYIFMHINYPYETKGLKTLDENGQAHQNTFDKSIEPIMVGGIDLTKSKTMMNMLLAFENEYPGQGLQIFKEFWKSDDYTIKDEKGEMTGFKHEGKAIYDIITGLQTKKGEQQSFNGMGGAFLDTNATATLAKAFGNTVFLNRAGVRPENIKAGSSLMNRVTRFLPIGVGKAKMTLPELVKEVSAANIGSRKLTIPGE